MAARTAAVYLNLVVILAFLVGQVRYQRLSYYCTMTHNAVGTSALGTGSVHLPCSCSCKAFQWLRSSRVGPQLAARGCIRIINRQKKIVSSFVDSVKVGIPFNANLCLVSLDNVGLRSDTYSFCPFFDGRPPPPDLAIVNRILRI